ncbi:MAG TPA: CBS domain-containing protein [Candidatus Nanoarchaeia archaeon]|nr:CBS domain-containing protein [Candidatus Nanoarchaeia archaeon]
MLVKEIMKRPLVVEKDISLAQAAGIMSKHGIGSLLFVSENKIKGIVTEGDLIRNFNKHEKISKIMSSKIKIIGPEDGLDIAISTMRENKVKRLPVVDGGKLVGFITLTDIMANFEALEEDFFFD